MNVVSLLSAPTVETATFWDGCRRGELLLNHCDACSRFSYFPRLHCPRCGSRSVQARPSSGKGIIYSWTNVRFSPFGDQWESSLPYCVAQIDLVEGVRFLSRILRSGDETVSINNAVELSFVDVAGADMRLPFFRLVHESSKEATP
jgi:uncharacterized OB-fold protein